MKQYKGFFAVILSAVLFGVMPLLANLIHQQGGTPILLTFLRNLLALPFLCLLACRQGGLRITRNQLLKVILLSAGFAGTPLLLFSSYQYIPSGMATTIHFVYPVFVLAGCVLFFHEKLSRVKLCCALLCTGGILLFYTPGEQGNFYGLALAFLSGITYAFYIIYLDKSGLSALPSFRLGFYLSFCSSSGILLFAGATGSLSLQMTPLGWMFSILFALLIAVCASVLFQTGVKDVGPQRAAILSTFEPITSIAVGILFLEEPFTIRTLSGVCLILAAVLLLTLFDHC